MTFAQQHAADVEDDNYAGENVQQVTAELLTATKDGLHPNIAADLTPDPGHLKAAATAIVDNTSRVSDTTPGLREAWVDCMAAWLGPRSPG